MKKISYVALNLRAKRNWYISYDLYFINQRTLSHRTKMTSYYSSFEQPIAEIYLNKVDIQYRTEKKFTTLNNRHIIYYISRREIVSNCVGDVFILPQWFASVSYVL